MALPVHLTMTSIWIHRLQHEFPILSCICFTFLGFKVFIFFERISWQSWMNSPPTHKCSVAPWDCCMTKHFKHWFLWIYKLQIIYLKLSPCPFSLKIWPLSDILSHCTNLKILPYILYIYKAVARQINLQIASATMSGWFKVLSTVT